ncbi:MAG: hypothetical protein P8175_15555 [Deltaproteobacteria bacterium]|jgi:hypothetical protein
MIKKFSWLLLLLMTACAPWLPVGGPYESPSHRFSAVLPEKWMKLRADHDLLLSKDGPFLQYVLIQERPIDMPFEHTKKTLQRGMLANEAAQLIIDEISSDRCVHDFRVIENRPARIKGQKAFELLFTHKNRDGLVFKTRYYGIISGDWFYAIRYNAAERYYFDKDIHAFESILSSFELREKKRG